MMHILIAIPTNGNVATRCFESIYTLSKPKGCRLELRFFNGYSCEMARNFAVEYARKSKADYVLFVDSDIILPKYTLKRLMAADKDIVCGYYVRKQEGEPIAELFKAVPDGDGGANLDTIKESELPANSLCRIVACGFGCVLVKTSVFDTILADSGDDLCFKYIHTKEKRESEDVYFCEQALNHNISIYVDTAVRCGHVGSKIY